MLTPKAKVSFSPVPQYSDLYVIENGGGFSCFGFENARKECNGIAKELGREDLMMPENEFGTLSGYARYELAIEAARISGKRLSCGLSPQLIGLEHKRVEVVTTYGEKRRFYVGKSTGFIPIHLEIKTKRSHGGGSAEQEYKSVRVVGSL